MALTRLQRIVFGFGHVFNDLCASIWFTYLITYMMNVLKFSMGNAGNLMIIGQLADGLGTTFVGLESDRTSPGGFRGYGRRKTWHAVGSFCVLISFPFIFNPIPCAPHADEWARLIYYGPLIALFQFGWAAVQNSHLSLIPQLAETDTERTRLNSIRFAFTVASNIVVYLSAFLLLKFNELETGKQDDDSGQLSPADAESFRYLVFIVCSLGSLCTLLFHLVLKEVPNSTVEVNDNRAGINDAEEVDDGVEDRPLAAATSSASTAACTKMLSLDWLKEPQFYAIGTLYMLTRLIINVAQVYLPLLVTESFGLHKAWIAIVPLVVYFVSMLTSVLTETCHALGRNRKVANLLGLALIGGFSASAYLVQPDTVTPWQLAFPALSLGIGSSIIMIMSMSLTADLIGPDRDSSAFVYGCMSLVDKLANGVTVWIVQHTQPHMRPGGDICMKFFREIEGFGIGGFAAVAFLLTLCLLPVRIGQRRKLAAKNDGPNGYGSVERRPDA
ncbi:hypothetical protein BOX15_Mlig025185g1 [Macrostomum lignano]|uniref:Major facilitator superfamily domain-containing protein 12 n=2 Tax=Macrostomum lignano TaxID=282301 RepID=A0A1I8GMH5_9PLAT|nr:hypothetical protein BOX15_Mlig025185g1 [Macrostomum lignano]